jgi:FKBP-type peptidyl-prolyl cis-trans isomerase FkpA
MKKWNTILKIVIFLPLASVLIPACIKTSDSSTSNTPANEAASIKKWKQTTLLNQQKIDSTASGLYYIVQKVGTGEYVQVGDSVTVKYAGMLLDGTVFDSSSKTGVKGTFKFLHKAPSDPTRTLLQGWEEGIGLLRKGGNDIFLIPSAKAYGAVGNPPTIPPYTPLLFVIEVLDIKKNTL